MNKNISLDHNDVKNIHRKNDAGQRGAILTQKNAPIFILFEYNSSIH